MLIKDAPFDLRAVVVLCVLLGGFSALPTPAAADQIPVGICGNEPAAGGAVQVLQGSLPQTE